jgi:hypothetical protein
MTPDAFASALAQALIAGVSCGVVAVLVTLFYGRSRA